MARKEEQSRMAKIKSAEKQHRQSIKREARNRVVRGSTRTAVKKARAAIAAGDPNAETLVRAAEQALDKAATKGVIHANNAGRRKSRLYLALNRSQVAQA
jgi:small subunit ribosomal protein S20